MSVVLLLAASTALTHCTMFDLNSEIEHFICGRPDCTNNEDVESGTEGFINLGTTEKTTKGSRPSVGQKKKINQKLKELTPESSNYDLNMNESIFKTNSGRRTKRTVPKSDIILTKNQFFKDTRAPRTRRQVLRGYSDTDYKWTDGVFYTFNTSDHIIQKLFKMGARVWSEATCIDFVEDKNAKDKVVVVKEPHIFSDVGRYGGDQLLSLGEDNVTVGSAVHEIGHVLGFFHTMERYDRDRYIRIVVDNIDPHHSIEFGKRGPIHADVYGLTYDYGSIMHYTELSGSINQRPTMIAKDPHYQKTMGSQLISFSDIYMINEHYKCKEKCNKSTSAKCVNEGYPHPRNCSICICPSGYGGTLCDRRPLGCGNDLTATDEKQTVVHRLGSGSDLRDQFDFCNYMITAPEGKKIEVHVLSISHGYYESGCPRGGVEIKAQKDHKLTGYR